MLRTTIPGGSPLFHGAALPEINHPPISAERISLHALQNEGVSSRVTDFVSSGSEPSRSSTTESHSGWKKASRSRAKNLIPYPAGLRGAIPLCQPVASIAAPYLGWPIGIDGKRANKYLIQRKLSSTISCFDLCPVSVEPVIQLQGAEPGLSYAG